MTSTDPSTVPIVRTDEATFRAAVPEQVDRFPILAVGKFRPGTRTATGGVFASAVVLTTEDRADPGMFATHELVFDDERGTWSVFHGDYCLTLRQAVASMDRRGGLS